MTTVLTDTTTQQGLYEHTKYLTGQDALAFEDFVRLANFAIDDYSSIVFSCDGRWRFDDRTNSNVPDGYTQVVSGQRGYTLDAVFLQVQRVEFRDSNGSWRVLEPVDQRDWQNESIEQTFATAGTPRYYDFDGQQIKLYPAPDFSDTGDNTVIANNSLKVEHARPANYFETTDGAVAVGIPRVHHEYLSLKAAEKVLLRTNDPSITSIRQELVKWEGRESNGQMNGGKIREYFTRRDEDRPRKLTTRVTSTFRENAFKRV